MCVDYKFQYRLKLKMISFLRKTALCKSFFLKPSFAFSVPPKKSFEELKAQHKAILSSWIIQRIYENPANEHQKKKAFNSLRQDILEYINKYQTEEKDTSVAQSIKAARDEIMKYFEGGVWVPEDMCGQNRFQSFAGHAIPYYLLKQMKQSVEVNIQETDPNYLNSLTFRKVNFCPTHVITGQIFQKIFNSAGKQLVKGHYGVGKTYSFILYTLLSENIFRYRHKYWKGKKSSECLAENINFKIPKSIYWSVNFNSSKKPKDFVNKMIKRQCYELKDFFNQNVIETEESLNDLYMSNLETALTLILDQINEIASAERQWRAAQINLKNFLKNHTTNKEDVDQVDSEGKNYKKILLSEDVYKIEVEKLVIEIKQAKEKHDKAIIYKEILEKFIDKGHFLRIIYLSSVDIEESMLKYLHLTGLSNHDPNTPTSRVMYPIVIAGDLIIADTCEFIVFLLRSAWLKKNQSKQSSTLSKHNIIPQTQNLLRNEMEKKLQQIKEKLNQILRSNSYGMVLPLSINWVVKQKKFSDFEAIQNLTEDQLTSKMEQLIDQAEQGSIEAVRKMVRKFIEQKNQSVQKVKEKKLLLLDLWNQCEIIAYKFRKAQQDSKSVDQLEKKPQILDNYAYPKIQSPYLKKIYKEKKDKITAQLFGEQDEELVCYVNPIIICSVLNQKITDFYQLLINSSGPIFELISGPLLGKFIEEAIIKMLMAGGTTLLDLKIFKGQIFSSSKPEIQKITSYFMPIPKSDRQSYKNFKFLNSFVTHANFLQQKSSTQLQLVIDQINIQTTIKRSGLNKWNMMLPLKKKFLQDISQITQKGITKDKISTTSKLIDFVLCRYLSEKYHNLQINAYDVTIEKGAHWKKIEQFLEEYLNFKDKNTTTVDIQNKKVPVQLSYEVITSDDFDNDYEKYFENRISELDSESKNQKLSKQKREKMTKRLSILNAFTFKNHEGKCQIKAKDTSKGDFYLNRISIISMFGELQMSNPEPQKNFYKKIFEKCKKDMTPQIGKLK